jgi:hypothetical protein
MSLSSELKNREAGRTQQNGAMRFYIQNELVKSRVIERLKLNLEGQAGDGEYRHRATGALEKSIRPANDIKELWGKNIKTQIKVDPYLGLGVSIEEVSVRIDMLEYGDKISNGFRGGANVDDIVLWIKAKARRYPTSGWYLYSNNKPYYYYGEEVTDKVAKPIATAIADRINSEGYQGTKWQAILKGRDGLNGSLQRAFQRYLMKYDEWTEVIVRKKLDKMLAKLIN